MLLTNEAAAALPHKNNWTVNKESMVLTGLDCFDNETLVHLQAQDSCPSAVSVCGNTSDTNTSGAISTTTDVSGPTRFIVTPSRIYSVDAAAFVIPDTQDYGSNFPEQYPEGCMRGMNTKNGWVTLTLTDNEDLADAWLNEIVVETTI